ncbi:hypothetical protein CBER1_05139 [Cercospora berteroae]|uniref:Uncharacterized protein n=1 Tax=Cercospora berteroae TaxID=357750 RepID=A0A2S6C3A8_9PEZI|nr:hypothetical protein CBER1_05139 [Cercospora berteroae]
MVQSRHSKAASRADPAPAPARANAPAPANTPPSAELALFSTLASAAKLLLEALGSRDLKADNHFTLETLRRAIRVSEPYIEIVLRELEWHEIPVEAGPSSGRRDAKPQSKSKSKSQGLLRYLPKLISIAAQLAKTREKRPNGSVRLTLLQELHEFLRVETKAARKEVKRLEHVLEGKHKRPRHRRHRGERGKSAERKEKVAAGGEGENGDGGEGEDDGEDDDDDGDGDDDGAPLLKRDPTVSNEAASNGKGRRSAGPSGGESNQHNTDRALVIRVQSPSTQRPPHKKWPLQTIIEPVNSRRGT